MLRIEQRICEVCGEKVYGTVCWSCRQEEVELRQEVLKCKFTCRKVIEACSYCVFKFTCHTEKSRKFRIIEHYTGYDTCIVYANDNDEALELLHNFGRDTFEPNGGDDSADFTEVEELDADGEIINEY